MHPVNCMTKALAFCLLGRLWSTVKVGAYLSFVYTPLCVSKLIARLQTIPWLWQVKHKQTPNFYRKVSVMNIIVFVAVFLVVSRHISQASLRRRLGSQVHDTMLILCSAWMKLKDSCMPDKSPPTELIVPAYTIINSKTFAHICAHA